MKYKLYQEVCFTYNKKKLYGQIMQIEKDKYKIISYINNTFYPLWINEKDIIPERRTKKRRVKKDRRQKPNET